MSDELNNLKNVNENLNCQLDAHKQMLSESIQQCLNLRATIGLFQKKLQEANQELQLTKKQLQEANVRIDELVNKYEPVKENKNAIDKK